MAGVQKRKIQWAISLLLVMLYFFGMPAQAQYGGGSGTADDPYLIYTAEQMNAIGLHEEDWDKHFKLMDDIDLAGFTGTDFNIIGTDYDNPFTGVFDGNGHTISNFTYISTDENDIGLFRYVEGGTAKIKHLGLINPNVDAETGWSAGSLAGSLSIGAISNCYVEGGSVSGNDYVGGLVGFNLGTITNCYSTASVSGYSFVGGLVGQNALPSTITNCYSTGSVSGNEDVGGLVGTNLDTIKKCYATGSVRGTGWYVGGLVGDNHSFFGSGGTISNSFWDIETSRQTTSAGGTGKTTAEMQMESTFTGAGWDFTTPIWTIDEGVDYPRLWWERQESSKYGGGSGTADDPFLIYTAQQMNAIGLHEEDWEKHFKLMADIDLSAFTGIDFNIIGYCISVNDREPFTGVFDGNGHTISDFSYTSADIDFLGLFGHVGGTNMEIKNLGLIDPNVDAGTGSYVGTLVGFAVYGDIRDCYVRNGNVSGYSRVGGLAGHTYVHTITDCHVEAAVSGFERIGGLVGENYAGIIENCSSVSTVNGAAKAGGLVGLNEFLMEQGWFLPGYITGCCAEGKIEGLFFVGGLVGENLARVTNSYAATDVIGSERIGGLVGHNYLWTGALVVPPIVSHCYSVGRVVGDYNVGGLVGDNEGGTVTNSFWDIETSGLSNSDGGMGRTTSQMQMQSTFTNAGWDFIGETANGTEDSWWILEGQDYPRLWWENKPGEAPETQQLSDFLTGAGTEDDPYLIYTAEQMNEIGLYKEDWDKHFKLMADINLSRFDGKEGRPEFNIIGWTRTILNDRPFRGVFDGNDHTISNFTWSSADRDNIGIFGFVRDGEIKNLRLSNAEVDAKTRYNVGLLVGSLLKGTITNCSAEGGRVLGNSNVGGLVGENYRGTITRCYTTGSVTGNNSVGGLLGLDHGGIITGCYARGNVTGNEGVGGLVGVSAYNFITNCYATSSVKEAGDIIGGLVGGNYDGTISDCYVSGSVSGNDCVGGFVGYNDGLITNCYSAGSVSGIMGASGLVGMNDEGTVQDSFWDTETRGQVTSDGGTGKTTAEMQTGSTFTDAGWDFMDETENGTEDIWWILEGQDYPRLWWELVEE